MKITIDIDGEAHTVELPDEAEEGLRSIATRNGLSLEDAIAQAVVNEKLIEDQLASGGKLLIEKGNRLRELTYEPV